MPRFSYIAVEAATGRERTGAIEGATAERVIAVLKERGLAPTSLRAEPANAADSRPPQPGRGGVGGRMAVYTGTGPRPEARWRLTSRRGVSPQAVAVFTRQLATLVGAGMPLVRALGVLAKAERNPVLRAAIASLAEAIRGGGSLSDSLRRHPRIFAPLYVDMVRAGETGGLLAETLERLARFLEKTQRIKARIRSALTYPLVVLLLTTGIVAALMVFVVPRFEQIFAELLRGRPLPGLTRAVIAVSAFVHHHAVVAVGLAGLAVAGGLLFRRSRTGRRLGDRLALRLPVFGTLWLKAAVARFTRTLGSLLASGVPILEALRVTRDTSGNAVVAEAIMTAHDRVERGESLSRPLAESGVFPGMVTGMIEVGEETGALPAMLGRIADAYEEDVDNALAALTSLIEPVLIVFLAVTVGTVVLALFLPIVSVIQYLL